MTLNHSKVQSKELSRVMRAVIVVVLSSGLVFVPTIAKASPIPQVAVQVAPFTARPQALCFDGWRSKSSGRGTCSWHGGCIKTWTWRGYRCL